MVSALGNTGTLINWLFFFSFVARFAFHSAWHSLRGIIYSKVYCSNCLLVLVVLRSELHCQRSVRKLWWRGVREDGSLGKLVENKPAVSGHDTAPVWRSPRYLWWLLGRPFLCQARCQTEAFDIQYICFLIQNENANLGRSNIFRIWLGCNRLRHITKIIISVCVMCWNFKITNALNS